METFAREYLFGPLGISDARWPFSLVGVAMTGGGLDLRTRDLLKCAQLYADGGSWNADPVLPREWVEASLRPRAQIDERTEYGYLWWLWRYTLDGREVRAFGMTGTGGNRAMVFPELDLAVAITTTDFRVPEPHAITDRLLTEYILPAARTGRGPRATALGELDAASRSSCRGRRLARTLRPMCRTQTRGMRSTER